jgi:hypothetical protein
LTAKLQAVQSNAQKEEPKEAAKPQEAPKPAAKKED